MATTEPRITYRNEPARTLTPRLDAAKEIVAPISQGFKDWTPIDDIIRYSYGLGIKNYENDISYNWREDSELEEYGKTYPDLFDNVRNRQQALDLRDEINQELDNQNSPGYMLGSIMGIIADPLLFGIGPITKGITASQGLGAWKKRLAITGSFTGIESIQEGLRQSGSYTRPAELSYLTIAGTGVISSVIAGFAVRSPRHANLYRNKKLIDSIAEAHHKDMIVVEKKTDPASRFYKIDENSNLRPIKIPQDVEKTLKKYDTFLVEKDLGKHKGKYVYAKYNPKTGEVFWNPSQIKDAWYNKEIQNQTIVGKKVGKLFRNWQEFAQYTIRHEVVHARFPRKSGESTKTWEQRVNKIAYDEWKNTIPVYMTFDETSSTPALIAERSKLLNYVEELNKEGILHFEGSVIDPKRWAAFTEPTLLGLKEYKKRNSYLDIARQLQLSPTGVKLELLPDALNKRFYSSISVNARLASQILDQPAYLEMGKLGKTLGLSGERWVAHWKGRAIVNYAEQERFYKAYRTRVKQEAKGKWAGDAEYPEWKLIVRRLGFDPKRGDELTLSEFMSKATLYRLPVNRAGQWDKSIHNGKKIPEIIKASKHQTEFYQWADDQLALEGTYVAFARTVIERLDSAIYRAKKTGGPVAFNSSGKEMNLKRLQGELAKWRDVKRLRETTRFNASTYFPLVKNQGLIKTEKKEFISLIQRPTKERPEGLTPAQALKEYEKIQKINYFKPMDGDMVGWASSLHRRESVIDWTKPELSKFLITDPKRLQLYYAKSMGADFWLGNFNRQFASKRQVALHGLKGRLSKEQLKEYHTRNNLQDLLQLINDDYINLIKQLGGRLKANPYNYQFKIEDFVRSPVVAKSASMKAQIKFTKPKDIDLFWGRPKQYKGKDMEGVTPGSKEPDLVDVSKNNKNYKQIEKLLKERKRVLSDTRAARDLLRGTYGLSDNPMGVKSTIIRAFKSFNTLTMLQGFQSAYPDLGRIAYFNGLRNSFGGQLQELASDLVQWKKMAKVSRKNAQVWEEAIDLFVATRARAMADLNEFTSFAHKSERVLDTISTLNFAFINAMSSWNTVMKEIAGMSWQTTVIPILKEWGSTGTITPLWRRRFARAGLATEGKNSQVTMDIVRELNKTEGIMEGKALRIANTDNWTNKKARDAFNGAMSHDIPIQIVTPGKGDVALWTNTEYGGLIAQFKKFTQAATNRVLMAGLQEGPKQFALQMAYMIPLGMFVDYMRTEHAFGHDWSKKPFLAKLYDGIERSALLGYFTDVDRTIMAWSDNQIGIKALLGVAPHYGTTLQRKLGAVPTLGAAATFGKVFTDTITGEYDWHTARNVRRLLPFQNVFWLDSIFDKLEKGLRP